MLVKDCDFSPNYIDEKSALYFLYYISLEFDYSPEEPHKNLQNIFDIMSILFNGEIAAESMINNMTPSE